MEQRNEVIARHERERAEMTARHQTAEFRALNAQVELARVPFRQEQERLRRENEERFRQQHIEWEAQMAARAAARAPARDEQHAEDHEGFLARIRNLIRGNEERPANRGELGNFANDTQNVHTTT